VVAVEVVVLVVVEVVVAQLSRTAELIKRCDVPRRGEGYVHGSIQLQK
jgi:hypothetical protein